ncbi:MAG: hypothetical protein AAF288_14005 [Planctomycetota bacterium]
MTIRWFLDRNDPASRARWALLLATPPAGLAVGLLGLRHAAHAGDRLASALAGLGLLTALGAAAAVIRKARLPFRSTQPAETDA